MLRHIFYGVLLCLLTGVFVLRAEAQVINSGTDSQASIKPASHVSRIEIFGGYASLPETDSVVQEFSDAGQGVAAGANVALGKYIGLSVNFDTSSWTVHARNIEGTSIGDQDIRLSYISVGPRFTARSKRFAFFGMPTLDYQWSRFSDIAIITPEHPEAIYPGSSANAWGFGVGGGTDLSVTKLIALRLIQMDYSFGGYGEGPGRNLRIKTGVVVRFK